MPARDGVAARDAEGNRLRHQDAAIERGVAGRAEAAASGIASPEDAHVAMDIAHAAVSSSGTPFVITIVCS